MPGQATEKPIAKQRNNDYPLVGETLGLWHLVRGIGRGGMGEVYEATYDYLHVLTINYPPEDRPRLRRELADLPAVEQARLASEMIGVPLAPDARFAVKVCNARSGTAGHKRFIQEAEVAQRLGDHPYVVTVHAVHSGIEGDHTLPIDSGKHRDIAFMVMDLATREYEPTRLSIEQSVHIIRAIATALDHAHKHGVVHRDLKPENFLGSIGHPLLTDFGIAKEIDHSLGLTRTGQIIGTLDYMSPEQATNAKAADHRSDIYSLGVVLYEFATAGHLPYVHLAEREACLAAIRSPRTSGQWPRDHIPDFPRSLERIILKATAHKAEHRYQSMSEFILDLDKYARGEWIAPWGRVRMERYWHYLVERHPRWVYGIPLVLGLLILLWLGIMLPTWMDNRRREYRDRLGQLEHWVTSIEAREPGVQQLPLEQLEVFERMRVDLAGSEGERYTSQRQRLESLLERLGRSRYLKTDFTHPRAAQEDQQQLRWAARVGEAPDWTISENGLLILGPTLMAFEPYGQGAVYVYLVATPRDGMRLTITEQREQRHRTVLSLEEGELIVTLQQDEQAPRELWRKSVSPTRDLHLGLEVSDQGIRAWLPAAESPLRSPGLREGAPAQVLLHLPQNLRLKHLQIWPEGPA